MPQLGRALDRRGTANRSDGFRALPVTRETAAFTTARSFVGARRSDDVPVVTTPRSRPPAPRRGAAAA